LEKLNIGVIFGGRSGEHQVSLMSARSVLSALDPRKYQVTQIGITQEGIWLTGENVLESFETGNVEHLTPVTLLPEPGHATLYQRPANPRAGKFKPLPTPKVFFPVLHGTYGEDGTLQGLLEMADVAYVGAGVLASSVAMDKGLFKDLMTAHQIPVVERMLVWRKQIETQPEDVIAQAEAFSPYPMFVKPANLGSSVGISKCHNQPEIREGLIVAALYDERILIERGIEAREIEVSVLGNGEPIASLPGEIIPADEFYSYYAKYEDNRTQLIIPAMLSTDLTQKVQHLATRAYKAINCQGMARVDFLIDKTSQEIFVSELNTIPGFTNMSMYPKLWEASGISYSHLLNRLIDLAIQVRTERDRNQYSFCLIDNNI